MSAVIGSNAPRIAVGVGPIYLIAIVRKIREMTVGKRPNPMASIQRLGLGIGCSSVQPWRAMM